MIGRSTFIKKVDRKNTSVNLSLDRLKKQSKSHHRHQQEHISLKKTDIGKFQFMGIVDKKVILTFSNSLQMFAFFDFHAIHERIRYEYYSWKLLKMEGRSTKECPFDEESIEKEGKIIKQIYQEPKKILLRVKNCHHSLLQKGNKGMIWGIQLEMNRNQEVYITSYRPVLGKQFTSEQIFNIIDLESQEDSPKVPKVIDDWLGEFSCKSAYKFNDELPEYQARLLIQNLQKCDFPWYCVHGRNTIHTKSMHELKK